MPVVKLASSNFADAVLGGSVVLIDCWASWCRPCKDFAPVFEAAAERHPNHTFATIDAQAERELTDELKVSHIPTLILFRDGILLLRQPGYIPAEGLDEIVTTAESLNMDQVRAQLAEEESRG